MNHVLSLQRLPMGGAEFLQLDSTNSNTCSSASTNGCIIKPGAEPGGGGTATLF